MSSAGTASSIRRTPWWLWPSVLSLDAPAVAVLWQAALAKVHHVAVMPALHVALFLAVWLIYVVDRVLDGFSMRHAPRVSLRHAFYQRNRWIYLLVLIPLGTTILFYLGLTAIPAGILWRGLTLGFVIALYLLHYAARGHQAIYLAGNILVSGLVGFMLWALPVPLHWKLIYSVVLMVLLLHAILGQTKSGHRLLPKELLCGFLFAIGCSMGVNFLSGDAPASWFSLDTLMLGLLCALNCTAISCYEYETDAHSDPNAITRTWPHIARVYPALLITLAVIAAFDLVQKMPVTLLLYPAAVLMSTLLLGVVHHLAKRISPDLAHVLADAAVTVPMALILLTQ